MEPIEWRRVSDFPHYDVSNDGQLRTWRRRVCKWRDQRDDWREAPMVIEGTVARHGYIAHMLRKPADSKPYRKLLHRLIAIAFLPNPDNLPDVAHNDGDPSNNCTANLRWSTHRDNQMDMRRHGTMQDGEKCITAKLTEAQARELRERLNAEGRGAGVRLAREYGLSKAQISRIKNGRRWACLD